MTDVTSIFLTLNALVTLACGLIISYQVFKNRVTGSLFHYAWAAGFLIYGIEILLSGSGFPIEVTQGLFLAAFLLFIFGVWQLCKTKKYLTGFIIALLFILVSSIIGLLGFIPNEYSGFFAQTVLFLFVGIAIFQNKLLFGKSADKLVIGWSLLYLTSAFLGSIGWISDVFAATAKIIILYGIVDNDFVIISDKAQVKRFPASKTNYEQEGSVKLLVFSENINSLMREVNWLRKKTSENVKEGVETIVFAFQDAFPHKELRAIKWIKPEKVSVYLFSSSAQKVKSEFSVLPMGLAQIGSALSQATNQCQKTEKGCTVVFLHLSLLIQVFGAEAVYNMLLNKMGYLRENRIHLYAVFYPTMHSDTAIVSLFTGLSDESIKL